MKKRLVLILFTFIFFTACTSTPVSEISEIESLPDTFQDRVDPDLTLQLFNDDGEGHYIVFHSSGEVEADVDVQDDTLLINLTETPLDSEAVFQHTFYLTTSPDVEEIDVLINGETMSFDNISI